MGLRERLIDPNSADRRPRRVAYALPTLFTAGNIFLGFLAILQAFKGAMAVGLNASQAAQHFSYAAQAIGAAVFLDGLDGKIARLTNTTSDFGREMDSLADVISFGLAPAVLAFVWGVQFVDTAIGATMADQLTRAGYFAAFLFLLCGACRLARFNIQKNPIPKNPGRPDRKYFVGMPIPAGAAMVSAVVFFCNGEPLFVWEYSAAWLVLITCLGLLMVSTWRYYSFKGVGGHQPYKPLLIVLVGAMIFAIWSWPQTALLAMAGSYVASGIVIRVGGIIRRRLRPAPPTSTRPAEHPIG